MSVINVPFLEPGAPEDIQLRALSDNRVLVRWNPPSGCHGTISHYTLSYMQSNRPQVDLHIRAGDMEQTWKEINNLTPGVRLEVGNKYIHTYILLT